MHQIYWSVVAALVVAMVLGVPLTQPAAVTTATALMICGGLPHGAYDIALLRRAANFGLTGLMLAVGAYVAIVALMAAMWIAAPLLALVLFLAGSSYHFGEDWPMLDDPLLRSAAGAAVIAAATIGHPAQVTALFVAMSDPRAVAVARTIIAATPVILLVTAVGIVAAWRTGSQHNASQQWPVAMAACLALLVILPPVVGFALFFVFLHSPRHLRQARAVLHDMHQTWWIATGALLPGVAILGWWAQQHLAPWQIDETIAAQAFQLLAAVAFPHLLLSHWLEIKLGRASSPGQSASHSRAAIA